MGSIGTQPGTHEEQLDSAQVRSNEWQKGSLYKRKSLEPMLKEDHPFE